MYNEQYAHQFQAEPRSKVQKKAPRLNISSHEKSLLWSQKLTHNVGKTKYERCERGLLFQTNKKDNGTNATSWLESTTEEKTTAVQRLKTKVRSSVSN